MANANAASFDGTNDLLTSGSDLTGNADSKTCAFSIWFLRSATGSVQALYSATSQNNRIRYASDDTLEIRVESTSGSVLADINSASTLTDTVGWHNITGSIDLASSDNCHLYVDDTADLDLNSLTDGSADWTQSNHKVGGDGAGNNTWNGCIGPVWIDFGQNIDFSESTNRRVFVSSDVTVPAALANSTDGNVGGFGQPTMFFNSSFTSYQNNLGSGGGFTENGALTDCTGPEVVASDPAGNGALAAGTIVLAALGVSKSLADGSLASTDSVIGGGLEIGFSGDVVDWDASNDDVLWSTDSADIMLWAPIAGTVPGQGISKSLGGGALDSTAVIAGSGAVPPLASASGPGVLVSAVAAIAGSGSVKMLGNGALALAKASVAGYGPAFVYLGNGNLAVSAATITALASVGGAGSIVGNVAGRKKNYRGKTKPRARKPEFTN